MELNQLRFTTSTLILLFNILLLLIGGGVLWAGFAVILIVKIVIDELVGDVTDDPVPTQSRFLDAITLFCLPLLLINSVLYASYFSSAETTWAGDFLGRFGIDFEIARHKSSAFDILGATMTIGVLFALGMNVTHELAHRTTDKLATTIGRWLAAFSLESAFELQHLTGHHMNGGHYPDPGTSRRGESYYAFLIRASIDNNLFAWRAERNRLQRRGLPLWSPYNRFLTGQAMTLALAALFYSCGGWLAVGAFFAAGLQGRVYFELAVYVEHYGLVRVPGTRFEPRHAWNSYRSVSNGALYNAGRHSHHHLHAGKPFYKLVPDEGAPLLPYGYMTMFVLAFIPPLYHAVMRPRLADWDLNSATEAERRYVMENGKELLIPAPAE